MNTSNDSVLNIVQKRLKVLEAEISLKESIEITVKEEVLNIEESLNDLKKEKRDLLKWVDKHYE